MPQEVIGQTNMTGGAVAEPVATTSASTAVAEPTAAEKIKSKAGEAGHAAQDEAKKLMAQASDSAKKAAAEGKTKMVEKASGISRLLEDSAQSIDRELGETYGNYVRSAATKVDDLIKQFDDKEIDELIDDARRLVRKSPALAIGAAAAAGFLITRLVKSGLDEDN